jgi:alkanesulfonate monooxygenase SsuD/methylene tetrahydromethanopterin reductase-like flavin-dependent oxidoreductase (luciferase family)
MASTVSFSLGSVVGHIHAMDVGLALPTMADGWVRATWTTWCRSCDVGPFSSVSCGERITFRNVEMLTTLAGAAALTERVRVMVNLAVAPWHATTLLAKQLATLDVLSGGRLDVGLGVGGRDEDYRAMGAPTAGRHQRLDDQVAELRRLWSGAAPVPGAPPLGPPTVQPGGPPLYIGATGPKALRRGARWAEGISGFSFSLDPDEVAGAAADARAAWDDVGAAPGPKVRMACFFVLDDDEVAAAAQLERFTYEYLEVFGQRAARGLSRGLRLSSPGALSDALAAVAATGDVDEVILVPGTVQVRCAELATEVVAARTW